MSKAICEQTLEVAIVADLVKGHYVQRPPSVFDKALCLDPGPLIDFIQATQPMEWAKFVVQHISKVELPPRFPGFSGFLPSGKRAKVELRKSIGAGPGVSPVSADAPIPP
jgi:hypothetical protein